LAAHICQKPGGLQTRNDARKNKTKKYNVDIQIK
ncbi:hypothetical protein ACUOBA_10975, partial [Escherichia coli]